MIHQTAPQFFPEFRLLARQIFQLADEVREYLLRVILLLVECLQFLLQLFLFCVKGLRLTDRFNQPLHILYGFLFRINQGVQRLEEHLLAFWHKSM